LTVDAHDPVIIVLTIALPRSGSRLNANCRWQGPSVYLAVSIDQLREAMMSSNVSGAQGYAEQADLCIERWEAMSFAELHKGIVHLLPQAPARVLDVGAGSGRDAAALAARGYEVVAVEPVDTFRMDAASRHPSSAIDWVDDALPELPRVCSMQQMFDVIMLTAVWMHLADVERVRAMAVLSSLLRVDGLLVMTLRHGPVPIGRRMFDVSASETIALARQHCLQVLQNTVTDSVQKQNQASAVRWTHLAFRRGSRAEPAHAQAR
jgi:SAM-dependent methyltransferase